MLKYRHCVICWGLWSGGCKLRTPPVHSIPYPYASYFILVFLNLVCNVSLQFPPTSLSHPQVQIIPLSWWKLYYIRSKILSGQSSKTRQDCLQPCPFLSACCWPVGVVVLACSRQFSSCASETASRALLDVVTNAESNVFRARRWSHWLVEWMRTFEFFLMKPAFSVKTKRPLWRSWIRFGSF